MKPEITGIHHVTAIASDPQRNIDFYAGLLGLRMVKKTVNFDDPSAYHLYYGDETGSPGSIVTFFYWPGHDARGRRGSGQTTALVFSAPEGSLDYWAERLKRNGVNAERKNRFGEEVLFFSDPDQIPVEIVAVADDKRTGWTGAGIPQEHALRGLHTAELTVGFASPTEGLLSIEMGFRLVKREGNRARFEAGPGGSGRYADVIENASLARGTGGSGTIHHIAWSVPDDETELKKQSELQRSGYHVSPVMDRDYFHSIYYRERGGILFEIATETPGFAVDEAPEALGTGLKLPKQFTELRARIEEVLPPLQAAKAIA
jgi:glyoxalase family protein